MKYLYYHLWQSFTKIKTNDTPEYNSMFLISVAQFFNIDLIIKLLNMCYPDSDTFKLLQMSDLSKTEIRIYAVVVGITLFIINYFYLVKPRYKIKKKFENETKRQRIIGIILSYVYFLGSIIITFYFVLHTDLFISK